MGRKTELENLIAKSRKELNDIIDKEDEAENKKLIGKCFKFRNNYSCPEKPSDYWWGYMKIVKIKGGSLRALEFQVDKDGEITIRPSKFYTSRFIDHRIEIKESEFIAAWNKLIDKINAL